MMVTLISQVIWLKDFQEDAGDWTKQDEKEGKIVGGVDF